MHTNRKEIFHFAPEKGGTYLRTFTDQLLVTQDKSGRLGSKATGVPESGGLGGGEQGAAEGLIASILLLFGHPDISQIIWLHNYLQLHLRAT